MSQFEYLNKFSCLNINPSFDDESVFQVDLPDETRIYLEETPTVSYVWRNGGLVAHVPDDYLNVLDKNINGIQETSNHKIHEDSLSENINRKGSIVSENHPNNQKNEKTSTLVKKTNLCTSKILMCLLFVIGMPAIYLAFSIKGRGK